MEKETEVVVLGGGIAGVCTAYYLAKAGKEAVLIEKKELGCMASGANAAFIWPTYRPPGPLLNLAITSLKEYEGLNKVQDIEFERCGGLSLLDKEDQFEEWEPFVERQNKAGLNLKLINRRELLELEPNLEQSSFIVGAIFDPEAGHVNSLRAIYTFGDEAQKLGAKIYEYTKLLAINISKGQVSSLVTDNGVIKTKYIVNACGIHAGVIGKMVGIKIPIVPNREQLFVTEEVPLLVKRPMFTVSYRQKVEKKEGGKEVTFICNPQAKGNLLIGGLNDYPGEDSRTTFEGFVEVLREVNRFLPILQAKDVHIIRSFAKFYIRTPDILPILGSVEGLKGFLIAGGLNDYGMGIGPGVGKVISELICFGDSSISLKEYSLSRFKN